MYVSFKNQKINKYKSLTIQSFCVTALFLSISSAHLSAQNFIANSDQPIQYQVELIVFKRGHYADSRYNGGESWPKNIHLNYPSEVEYLLNDTQFVEFVTGYENKANMYDTNPNDVRSLLKDKRIKPLHFENRLLRQQARRIEARSEIDILFHEGWIQEIDDSSKAKAIALKGGQKYGEHYQLEGTIKLTRSRFLHAQTKFWLTSFGNNNQRVISTEPLEHWPSLPRIPNPLGSEKAFTDFNDSPRNNYTDNNLNSNSTYQSDSYQNHSNNSDDNQFNSSYNQATYQAAYQNQNAFQIENIALLDQKRKMRSGEIHYIDHPIMGAVILVRPIEQHQKERTSDTSDAIEDDDV